VAQTISQTQIQVTPAYHGVAYSWLRRYLKRRFRLKSWRWDLHVKENEREGWVKVSQNPFQVLKEARYRVQAPKMTEAPTWQTGSKDDGRTKEETELESKSREGPVIIIHLLGLAPAGYLAAPDNGA
jgi:hypothetical protein